MARLPRRYAPPVTGRSLRGVHVGLDLAWSTRGRTGLAVVDGTGALRASGAVRTDDEIATWLAVHLYSQKVCDIIPRREAKSVDIAGIDGFPKITHLG